MKNKKILSNLTQFKGVYLSGFFIQNPKLIPSMSLLFEKVYLPNQLEIVIGLSKKIRFSNPLSEDIDSMKFDLVSGEADNDGEENPLKGLTKEEQDIAKQYLLIAHQFCIRNHELFNEVFVTDLLENNEVYEVKLIEETPKGQLNKYQVKTNPLQVSTGGLELISKELENGAVPIIGSSGNTNLNTKVISQNKSIAAILAMQSISMMLPQMKSIKPELILETRDKLKDHLPPFWSAMLKFSVDAKSIVKDAQNSKEAFKECQNLVDVNILPAIIDLNSKMEKERKNWFYKVLTPVGEFMKLIMGKPDISKLDLLTSSMTMGTDLAVDFIQQKRKINELKEEAGLTYLLKVGQEMNRK